MHSAAMLSHVHSNIWTMTPFDDPVSREVRVSLGGITMPAAREATAATTSGRRSGAMLNRTKVGVGGCTEEQVDESSDSGPLDRVGRHKAGGQANRALVPVCFIVRRGTVSGNAVVQSAVRHRCSTNTTTSCSHLYRDTPYVRIARNIWYASLSHRAVM